MSDVVFSTSDIENIITELIFVYGNALKNKLLWRLMCAEAILRKLMCCVI